MLNSAVWKVAVSTAAAIAVLMPGESEASRTKELTVHHTSYGVSQFNYGNISPDASEPIRLMNPTGVTQAAAVFLYTRHNPLDRNPADAEVFVGCVVELLTPHASVVIPGELLLDVAKDCRDGKNCPGYAEVIWVPSNGRKEEGGHGHSRKGMWDGLGGRADAGAGQPPFQLAHPSLFTPPERAYLDEAQACIRESLDELHLHRDLFEGFEGRHKNQERRRDTDRDRGRDRKRDDNDDRDRGRGRKRDDDDDRDRGRKRDHDDDHDRGRGRKHDDDDD